MTEIYGQELGEKEREAIIGLADARLELVRKSSASGLGASPELGAEGSRALVRKVFVRIEAQAPEQAAELRGLARATGLAPELLLVLDGGLLDALTGAGIERSLGLYVDGPRGSVLAGAWALPPSEAAHVDFRVLPSGALSFGLPGSFGLAGIAAAGYAAITNLLRPRSLGPGIPGSILLRRLLDTTLLDLARAMIEDTPLVDGRNWMLGDARAFYGFEQLGAERILTRVGPKTGHVHANHCFDPSLRQREATPRSPASFRRLELTSTLYIQHQPATAAAVLDFFDAVEEAAFAEPVARAQTLLAIELEQGLAYWRRHREDRIHTTRFHTPLAYPEPPS